MIITVTNCESEKGYVAIRSFLRGHVEWSRGTLKGIVEEKSAAQSCKHHLSSWVYCHVAVTSDIMCGIMCCTIRQDNLGGLEHREKQSIRTELVPSMDYISALIAFVRVPPQIKSNPKDICELGSY